MGAVRRLMLSIAVLALLWVPKGADVQNAAALVLEKRGVTAPDVQPYSEVAAPAPRGRNGRAAVGVASS